MFERNEKSLSDGFVDGVVLFGAALIAAAVVLTS